MPIFVSEKTNQILCEKSELKFVCWQQCLPLRQAYRRQTELCYNITDAEAKTVEVAKYDYTVDGEMVRPTKMDVVVPMTVVNPNGNQTYRVTALGDGAFTVYGLRGGWFDYTSIVLPEGLLEIKANAFSG